MGYGVFEITLGAKGDAKSLEQIQWGATSGAQRVIVLDEMAAAGTADLMGHIMRGVKGDEGIDILQTNKALLKAEMD